MEPREAWLAHTFVELSDTLVADFDLLDLYVRLVERCATFLEGCEVALHLEDASGALRFIAASTEEARLVELIELQALEGPGFDAFHGPVQIVNLDLRAGARRWPRFAPAALGAGYRVVHALPMRLRDQVLGALTIFDRSSRALAVLDVEIAQALTAIAAIALLQERAKHHEHELALQLQRALNSRIAVEQAKGVLAEHLGLDVDAAFSLLRRYARHASRRLDAVAEEVVARTLSADALLEVAREATAREGARPASAGGDLRP